jgi:hypothetical protein
MFREPSRPHIRRIESTHVGIVFHTSLSGQVDHIMSVAKAVGNGLTFVGFAGSDIARSRIRNVRQFIDLSNSTGSRINLVHEPFGNYLFPGSSNLMGVLVTNQEFNLADPSFGSIVNRSPMGAAFYLANIDPNDHRVELLIRNGLLRAVGKMFVTPPMVPTDCGPNCILEGVSTFTEFVQKFGDKERGFCASCDVAFERQKVSLNYAGAA